MDISKLPDNMLEQIMLRVPLESLVECRKWRSTIREEGFERLYWAQSITRPRLLFEYTRIFPKPLFQSVYQQEEPLLSSGLKKMVVSSPPYGDYCMFSAPQRGLVCLGDETKFVLCNPATSKVKALPECERLYPVGQSRIICFFGYDEVTKVFKFLISEIHHDFMFPCEFPRKVPQQVFTVELAELHENIKEKPWRVIECQHNHVPVTESLCLNGVLYYGAKSLVEMDKSMIISFELRSENFTIIDMPQGVKLADVGDRLVNYNGEVCLVKDLWDVRKDGTRVYEMYARDENARQWREVPVVIPSLGDDVGKWKFCCVGNIGTLTGELVLVFATDWWLRGECGSALVLYYYTATRTVRLFNIGGVRESLCYSPQTFVNHCDSPLLT
ncbi:unnamed protein product [Eruca vesicaria subsp. sativa]|uniref:F-box associated beta-propeller type 3 domain-containing protein n=1 Tax=Eruca vesicaria subsp. sativa TaxID=29727 RepID=A0ABC8J1L5_ERUVS|nr:unnamed protein product [Eruca vesicaria subsp. sativa]